MWNSPNTRFLSTRSVLKRHDEIAVMPDSWLGRCGKGGLPNLAIYLDRHLSEDKRIVIDLLAIAA